MARRAQITRQGRLQALEQDLAGGVYLLRTELILHEHGNGKTPCICCGNKWARATKRRRRWELLIDADEGYRYLKQAPDLPGWVYERQDVVAAQDWPDVIEGAEVFEIPIRCTEKTLEVITDHEVKIRGATGGARSMKTHSGGEWALEEWMLTGGPESLAWMAGPELQHAMILRDKWCLGEPGTPPIVPPELVTRYPLGEHDADKHIYMVDGTRIRLQHMKGDGSNLSGRGIDWSWLTELAAVRDRKNWGRLRGRVVSSGGRIYYDRVPEPKHWSKAVTVARSERQDVEETQASRDGKPFTRSIRNIHLSSDENPWNDPVESAEFIRELEEIDPRLADREGRGLEVGDAHLIFGDVWSAAKHTFSQEGWAIETIPGLELEDVTRQVSLHWFVNEHPWLVGVDVNQNPVTHVPCKIFTEKGANPRNPANWGVAYFDVFQVWGQGPLEAARLFRERFGGVFKDAGVVMDGTACVPARRGPMKGSRLAKEWYEEIGFEVRGPDRRKPSKRSRPMWCNPRRIDRSLMQRRLMAEGRILVNRFRCGPLVQAFRDQEAEGDGVTPVKESNTWGDRHVYCLVESSGYVAWPFFGQTRIAAESRPRRDLS